MMLNTFAATLSPMLVMFLCIAVGFLLRKGRFLPENAAAVLSKLEANVLMPALILNTFIHYCTPQSIQEQADVLLWGILYTALSAVVGTLLSRSFSKESYTRNIYRYGLVSANFGFLGNTVVPQIMGGAALYEYLLFTLPMSALVYGWLFGTLIPGDQKKGPWWKNMLNPTVVSMLAGVALGLSNAIDWMPDFVTTAVGNVSACMGPIAMILTGFIIGGYEFSSLLKLPKVYAVTFLRLILLPVLMAGGFWLMGVEDNILLMTLFATGTALGLNVVVVPAAYGGDTRTGAAMAMISHVLCIVTIPLLYALLAAIL